MKIAVFGTPQFAADIFEALYVLDFIDITSAITMPNKPSGRGKKEISPPVAQWAKQRDIQVIQPQQANKELAEELKRNGVEVCVFLAYGSLVPKSFLENAPECWNLHLSLLPAFRGASPVQQALLEGKKISGVTVFELVPKMDAGDILGTSQFSIENLRADEVYNDCVFPHGTQLLRELLQKKSQKKEILHFSQDESKATFCGKIEKKDGFLEPKKMSADMALRKIRAYFPWPGTSIAFRKKRLKIHQAKMSEINIPAGTFMAQEKNLFLGFSKGTLELLEVQPEGKKSMSGGDFSRGYQI